ncbi:hypothetical protein ACFOLF_01210 [Paenibacillus sepulcri]|uniref:CTP synthase (glutamine hydrolyzing) n=1 Tax=Paenibacillus sepulcri TaxID=359917 RepID=A0ABS7C8Q9_9BACL|nr:hypothetical protein [Paenibacillus sepulcri]
MKIGIVGDFNPAYPSQQAAQEALVHSSERAGISARMDWIPSTGVKDRMYDYNGYWIAPGVPKSLDGVLQVIQYARQNQVPVLGTCGGFQYMVMEFARNVLQIEDIGHEEQNPAARNLIISRLSCSLAGQDVKVIIMKTSRVYDIYQTEEVTEPFRCSFGLNAAYITELENAGLLITGSDSSGEPRVIEMPEHPFYIGTLFVPQLRSTPVSPHCLVDAFLEHASR